MLLAIAVEARVVKTGKVRADTTVVSANVRYPTDSGLLASAVAKMGRLVRRIKTAGAATRTRFRDRSRSAARRVREIASKLRLRGAAARHEAQAAVIGITGELAQLAEQASAEAATVVRNARRTIRRSAPIRGPPVVDP
jgi:IS5 family transposase